MTVSDLPGPTRILRTTCLVLLAALLALEALLAAFRFLNPDEGQHLHAILSISGGQVMYRDFFEHHGPLFHHLGQLPRLLGTTAGELVAVFRGLALACWGLTLALVFGLGRALSTRDRTAGWWSLALLAPSVLAVLTALEIRPDDVHVPVVLASLLLLLRAQARGSSRLAAASGLLSGLSLLVGPRALFIGFATTALLFLDAVRREGAGRREAVRRLLLFALGALAPVLLGILAFAAAGALPAFLDCVLRYNLRYHYQAELPTLDFLRQATALDPCLWGLGLAGLVQGLRHPSSPERRALALVLLLCLASLPLTPVATWQYMYVTLLPFLAVNGGAFLEELAAGAWRWRWAALGAGLLGLIAASFALRPAYLGAASLLYAPPWLVLGVAGAVAAGLSLACLRAPARAAALAPLALVPLLLVWMGLLALLQVGVDAAAGGPYGLRRQLGQMDRIAELAGHEGTALDGFSGLVFLQPHLDHHWVLHDHAVDMAGRPFLQRRLGDRLRRQPPAVIVADGFQRYLWRDHGDPAVAGLPFWVETPEDDLWRVAALYRPAFDLGEQIIFPPSWPQSAGAVLRFQPVERRVPTRRAPPGLRPLPGEWGEQVLVPVAPAAGPLEVAVPVDEIFARGRLTATLTWRADGDPACPTRGRWDWRCGPGERGPGCRYEHAWGAGALALPGEQRVLGGLTRFEGEPGLFVLFELLPPAGAGCLAFHVALGNAAGLHRLRDGARDFALRLR